jgi:type I restriction enzyme S subunit
MGELPEEWEWKRLEEIAEINSRFDKNSFDDETEVTFLPMRCVEELTGRMDTSIKRKYGEIKTGYTPIQEGDLIFAKITPCIENGKIAIAKNLKNGIGFASTEFHTLKFSPDNETKFYFFYLMQEKIRQEAARNMTGTAGQQRVPVTFLKRLKVPVPPLPIQRQIVAVLEQTEAVKRQRQEADALTGALLQSVFYEMFGDPVRNERGWDIIEFGVIICETKNGLYKTEKFQGKGTPILRMYNIYKNRIVLDKYHLITITDNEFEQYQVKPGDILFNRVNSPIWLGKSAVIPKDIGKFVFESKNIRIRVDTSKADPEYIVWYLSTPAGREEILKRAKAAVNQSTVNNTDLREFRMLLPPLALQQQFARVVQDVERIRERQVASGKEIEGLCEGLMARAFAGELA